MKKLNRNHFKGLQSQFPVLSKEELEAIIGGDDCFFHCMAYLNKNTPADLWGTYFEWAMGGGYYMNEARNAINTDYIGPFLSKMGISYTITNSITPSQLNHCIMIFSTGETTNHAVIPVNVLDNGYIRYMDPECNNAMYIVHPNKVIEFITF